MTNIAKLTIIAAATIAAAIALPATAHGDDNRQKFASPSDNIRCVLDVSDRTGAPMAMCQIRDYSLRGTSGTSERRGKRRAVPGR
jgi:hypothetical protein